MNVKVGQKLWFVPNERHGNPREVTVTKVGRKWFETDGYTPRISVESLKADGGQYLSPGRCYLSKSEHTHAVATTQAWSEFKRQIERMWQSPDLEQITAAREALGMSNTNDKETT